MAGVPEKARFFLEQAVPQLREFEAKGIFTTDEIRSLVRKRTDYEHLVLSPGNKPTDWLNYAAWEKSLETLRAKRCRRLQNEGMEKREKKGGTKKAIQEQAEQSDDEIKFAERSDDEDEDDNVDENGQLILPDPGNFAGKMVIDEDITKSLEGTSEGNPALDGVSPLAIFDISKKHRSSTPR
ncbi:U3 small nucleolar RNA-associated protein 6 [Daldinia childiae]|uniref:U3 small nucleolar RNA-associated protein 6 n=1 Tax=Daldinia childiae TaxID=326645 RepID=UPI0014481E48|nr:U3 small nucleolar RNA-associated protein 6 [Daldinia childiae]KAF3059803.1 U3 small nucleolar RNA-associated protein 6 [Daldinia childiae]